MNIEFYCPLCKQDFQPADIQTAPNYGIVECPNCNNQSDIIFRMFESYTFNDHQAEQESIGAA